MDEIERQRQQSLNSIGTPRPDLATKWKDICNRAADKSYRICEQLDSMGVKALHPNDGWIKRDDKNEPYEVYFCYPKFLLPILIGDKIALSGWEYAKYECETVRLFEVTGIVKITGYGFENKPTYSVKSTGERYKVSEIGELTWIPEAKENKLISFLKGFCK